MNPLERKSLNVLFVTILLVLAYLICWSPYHFTYISIALGSGRCVEYTIHVSESAFNAYYCITY
jgi:hypothetical protein